MSVGMTCIHTEQLFCLRVNWCSTVADVRQLWTVRNDDEGEQILSCLFDFSHSFCLISARGLVILFCSLNRIKVKYVSCLKTGCRSSEVIRKMCNPPHPGLRKRAVHNCDKVQYNTTNSIWQLCLCLVILCILSTLLIRGRGNVQKVKMKMWYPTEISLLLIWQQWELSRVAAWCLILQGMCLSVCLLKYLTDFSWNLVWVMFPWKSLQLENVCNFMEVIFVWNVE
jgi:hypothetical protein